MNQTHSTGNFTLPPAIAERFPIWSPTNSYRVVVLATGLMTTLWMFERGFAYLSLVAILLAVLAAQGRVRFSPPMFLALVFVVFAFSNRREQFLTAPASPMSAWVLSASAMLFLIAAYRVQSLTSGLFPPPKEQMRWVRRFRFWRRDPPPEARRRDPASCANYEYWSLLGWTGASLLVAGLVYSATLVTGVRRGAAIPGPVLHLVNIIWVGAIILLIAATLTAHIGWRRQSVIECGTYLRSVVWRWLRREQYAIERYRAKRGRRRS